MFYLRNLISRDIRTGIAPWEFTKFDLVPDDCKGREGKKKRDAWINGLKTDFHVYSMIEGVQANLRMNTSKSEEENDNPPRVIHGLVADCDKPYDPQDIQIPHLKFKHPPAWFEHTLSNYGRFVWKFEKPLVVANRDLAIAFLRIAMIRLKINSLEGFEEAAYFVPERYYTNGCRWTKLPGDVIPEAVTIAWLSEALITFKFVGSEGAVDFEVVMPELLKKYPRFADWPGDFVVGASGPSFWIEGSESPKSAVVHEAGIYSFSGHASKPFYSWSELVGKEFIKDSSEERFGDAVKDVFYDGHNYFYPKIKGVFSAETRQNLDLWLRATKRLSTKKAKGHECSEVEEAVNFINENNYISGAAPCAFYKKGRIPFNGDWILNTHTKDVIMPAPEPTVWGEKGKFPWISKFLDQFYTTREQLDIFLARYQRHYRGCLNRQPVQGQATFICGDGGSGKTLLSIRIIGEAHGGSADASKFLVNGSNFNVQMFENTIWRVDDGTSSSSAEDRLACTERLKSSIANPEHACEEKFRKACMIPAKPWIVVTCNTDPTSARMIPSADNTIRDKLIVLKCAERTIQFYEEKTQEALILSELPHFLRWICDWSAPAHAFGSGDPRFGVRAFFEESLIRLANQSSPVNALSELLQKWLSMFFSEQEPNAQYWQGTATDLAISMSMHPGFNERLRNYRPEHFANYLLQIEARKFFKSEIVVSGEDRHFRFYRNGRFGKPAAPVVDVTPNSKFEKS